MVRRISAQPCPRNRSHGDAFRALRRLGRSTGRVTDSRSVSCGAFVKVALWTLLIVMPLAAAPATVKVRNGGEIVEISMERYVAAVLAGESSVFQSDEALKAMAVAARTYAVRMRGRHGVEGFDLCDTTHCQRLDLKSVTSRLENAAAGNGWRTPLVPGEAGVHAIHTRLRRNHRGRRLRLARSRYALSKEPLRSVLRTCSRHALALERGSAADRASASAIWIAWTNPARPDRHHGANSLRTCIDFDLGWWHRVGSDQREFLSLRHRARTGMEHGAR